MIPPARGWRPKSDRLFWRPLLGFLVFFVLSLALAGVLAHYQATTGLVVLSLLAALSAVTLTLFRLKHLLHDPLSHLRNWSLRMRAGHLSARVPVPPNGEFAKLAHDINTLSEELQSLTEDMDRQVRSQTERLAQKTRSLEVLYDVAASLNSSRDLDDLLKGFLRTLTEIVNARAGTVRLLTEDNQMRLVGSIGLEQAFVEAERVVPVNRCLCGHALSLSQILAQRDLRECSRHIGLPLFPGEHVEMIAVPLRYRDRTLGVYNLFTTTPDFAKREDMQHLLASIGQQLGMAVEKSRLDAESQRLSIMQERNMLAHELHDSLAQSLASLRLQSQMLQETLEQGDNSEARREAAQLKKGLDSSYAELRQLLVHFRTQMDERGLVPAIEDMVERFRRDSGINVFLQKECGDLRLPPEHEVQVLHIVQEALANMRKYSHAKNARVLLRREPGGSHLVLVEDDGLGINRNDSEALPGERLGLAIMQERAQRLSGTLTIESEPGEGTRIQLTFDYPLVPVLPLRE